MSGYTGFLTTHEKVELIAEELGYSLYELAQAKRQAEVVEEQIRQAKLAEEFRQQEIRKLERQKAQFIDDLKEGKCIVFVDDKLKSSSLCTAGEPDIDDLARAYATTRGALLMNFKGYVGGAHTAATIDRDLQCTCGKVHKIRVFVSSDK